MNLEGYDVSLDIGRTAANKVLAGLELLPIWKGTFAGKQESEHASGLRVRTDYSITLSRVRLRPAEEQSPPRDDPPATSVCIAVDVSGHAHSQMNHKDSNEPLLDYAAALTGQMAVVIHAVVRKEGGMRRLVVTFHDAHVQHVELENLPSDLKPILARAVAFIMEGELRRFQQDLPLTGLMRLRGSPYGALQDELLKSHFYLTDAGDLAVCVAVSMGPGDVPPEQKRPLALRKGGHDDVCLAFSIHYLNRLLGNVVAEMRGQEWRFGGSWDPRDQSSLELRSMVVSADDTGMLRAVVRIGDGRTLIVGRMTLVPTVDESRLRIQVLDVEVDVPGRTGVIVKLLTNVLYALVRLVVDELAASEVRRQVEVAEDYGSGLVLDREVLHEFPEGLKISSRVRSVRVDSGTIALDYRLTVGE